MVDSRYFLLKRPPSQPAPNVPIDVEQADQRERGHAVLGPSGPSRVTNAGRCTVSMAMWKPHTK